MKRPSAKDLRDSIRAARPTHDAAAERRLLAAARRGDRAALEAVTRGLSGALHRFGRGFCRAPHDAEDVMQDVLVALIESLSRFRGESSLSSWAYVVARNACARRRKRGARVRPLQPDDAPDSLPLHDRGPGPDVVAERRQLRADLESGIAALPGSLRDVLVLRDVEGLSVAQGGRRLRLADARGEALRVLESCNITRPDQIDLELIADSVGAEIVSGELAGAMGSLIRVGPYARIRVSERVVDVGAQRFTVGHEIGHIKCDRGRDAQQGIEQICNPFERSRKLGERIPSVFASELLMPEPMVKRYCAAPCVTLAPAREIADEFTMSLLASALRVDRA